MINLRSRPADLIREMQEDYVKAIYWLKKHWHGEKGYEQMRDRLLARCSMTGSDQTSEPVEFISKNGNKWLAYEHARYYEKSGAANCMPFAFCYYRTEASVGAFVPGFRAGMGERVPSSCIIYTPHFFERFCQRLGIAKGSENMVKRFLCCVPNQMMSSSTEPEDDGLIHVTLRLPGSVGKGIRWKGKHDIFEIRTYLTDKQLTKRQYKESDPVRTFGDNVNFEPEDMMMLRLLRSDNPIKEALSEIERLEKLGFDMSARKFVMNMGLTMMITFQALKLASVSDVDFWKRHAKNALPMMEDFEERYRKKPEGFMFFREYVDLAENIAAKDGIKKFSRYDFALNTLTNIYGWQPENAKQALMQQGYLGT